MVWNPDQDSGYRCTTADYGERANSRFGGAPVREPLEERSTGNQRLRHPLSRRGLSFPLMREPIESRLMKSAARFGMPLDPNYFAAAGRSDGRAWIASLPALVERRCTRWNLTLDAGPARFGFHAVVLPVGRSGTPLVLKLTWPIDRAVDEARALAAWDGRGAPSCAGRRHHVRCGPGSAARGRRCLPGRVARWGLRGATCPTRSGHHPALSEAAVRTGAEPVLQGAQAVAGMFSGRAQAAQVALIEGAPGLVWAPRGRPRVVFAFTIVAGKVVAISMIADREHVSELDLEL